MARGTPRSGAVAFGIDGTSGRCSRCGGPASAPDELLNPPARSYFRRVEVPPGIERNVVEKDELTGVPADATELTDFGERLSVEDVHLSIAGISHIQVLLAGVTGKGDRHSRTQQVRGPVDEHFSFEHTGR